MAAEGQPSALDLHFGPKAEIDAQNWEHTRRVLAARELQVVLGCAPGDYRQPEDSGLDLDYAPDDNAGWSEASDLDFEEYLG